MAAAARQVDASDGTEPRPSPVLLGTVIVLVGAWGGIAPYAAPLFGFSADGAPAWHWSAAHALLGLVPGAVAVASGLMLVGRGAAGRGVGLVGLVVVLCGAWFTIGEFAWPVLRGSGYFVGAAPLHYLLEQLAFAVGTGAVLVACGALALGRAARRSAPSPALAPG